MAYTKAKTAMVTGAVLLLATGLAILIIKQTTPRSTPQQADSSTRAELQRPETPPRVEPAAPFETISLEKQITTTTHNWGDVPYGPTICQDVPFECWGAIRLNGLRAAREGKPYPGAVLGVPVAKRGETIHVLHAAENWSGSAFGAPYGKILLHYVNGESHPFYLRFGIHGMDWYGGSRTPEETVSDPNTRLGWYYLRKDGSYRRFFHTIFANPLPEIEIASVDFIAPLDTANLWVFGFTLGNNADMLVNEVADPMPLERNLVALKMVKSTGQAATNCSVVWQAVLRNGFISFPSFPADNQGVVMLDLPPRGIDRVDFMASSPDGLGYVGTLQQDAEGNYPESIRVELSPGGATGLPPLTSPRTRANPPPFSPQPQ